MPITMGADVEVGHGSAGSRTTWAQIRCSGNVASLRGAVFLASSDQL